MADVKKKNTVTVEKQDGTKKEVQTKNVSTSKKESVGSKIKDRLISAYETVKPKVNKRNFSNGTEYSLSIGENEVGDVSKFQSPYSGGENTYRIGYNSDDDGYYQNIVNTPIGTFANGDDDGYRYSSYTSPIQKGNIPFTNGGSMDYVNYTPNVEDGARVWGRRINNVNEPDNYVVGYDTGKDFGGYYDKEIDTPLGNLGYGYEDSAVYGSYTSPITRYNNEIERGYEYSPNGVDKFGVSKENTGGIYQDANLYYDRGDNNILNGYIGVNDDEDDYTYIGGKAKLPIQSENFDVYQDLPLGLGKISAYNGIDGYVNAQYQPQRGSIPDRLIRAITRR